MAMQTVDEMISELIAAGWRRWKNHATIWESPMGDLYRGPALAWQIMKIYGTKKIEKTKSQLPATHS